MRGRAAPVQAWLVERYPLGLPVWTSSGSEALPGPCRWSGVCRRRVLPCVSSRRARPELENFSADNMTSRHWHRVWQRWPSRFEPTDHLRQVAKTVGGEPISRRQVEQLVENIVSRLSLGSDDVLLDLCCGNGLLTSQLARTCRHVTGVDFSEPLLAVARRDHSRPNLVYVNSSVLDIGQRLLPERRTFNKVLMYDALQFFAKHDFENLLNGIIDVATEGPQVCLAAFHTGLTRIVSTTRPVENFRRLAIA